MISRLLVQNFQAHEKLKIEFDEGVTTIVGPSDVGKSAIIRALRWVLQNTPQGTAFIRDGEPGCTVKVQVDGRLITRKRAVSGDNLYLLDGDEYKAFGVNVPDTIAKYLNVGPVNFQGQHDASFWLSLSAGEVSRQLNAVVDLSIIDSTMEEANRRVRAAQQQTQIRRDDLKVAKAIKESLEWVAAANVQLQGIEVKAVEAAAVAASAVQLRALCQTAQQQQEHLYGAKARLEQVAKVGRAAQAALKARSQRKTLQTLVEEHRTCHPRIQRGYPDFGGVQSVYQRFADIRRAGLAPSLRKLLKNISIGRDWANQSVPNVQLLNTQVAAYSDIRVKQTQLKSLINRCRTEERRIKTNQRDWNVAQGELEELTDGFCPVCNRPME